MIARIWHGFTTGENAGPYRELLEHEVLPGIAARGVVGYRGAELLSKPCGPGEVEFVTILWFDSWEAVKRFAGEDFERAYVPPRARELLARFDERSRHYELELRRIEPTPPGGTDRNLERF